MKNFGESNLILSVASTTEEDKPEKKVTEFGWPEKQRPPDTKKKSRLFLISDCFCHAHASFRASVLLLITAGSQSEMRTLTFCCKIYVGGILVFLSQDVKEIVKKKKKRISSSLHLETR